MLAESHLISFLQAPFWSLCFFMNMFNVSLTEVQLHHTLWGCYSFTKFDFQMEGHCEIEPLKWSSAFRNSLTTVKVGYFGTVVLWVNCNTNTSMLTCSLWHSSVRKKHACLYAISTLFLLVFVINRVIENNREAAEVLAWWWRSSKGITSYWGIHSRSKA